MAFSGRTNEGLLRESVRMATNTCIVHYLYIDVPLASECGETSTCRICMYIREVCIIIFYVKLHSN